MGTNYYIKKKERRVNEPDLHIGKKSWGWQFSWQFIEEDEYYGNPRLDTAEKWMEYIFLNSDCIYNEYNENISFEEFAEIVENNKPGSKDNKGNELLNHHLYCSKDRPQFYNPDDTFLDAEGWSFSKYDFS